MVLLPEHPTGTALSRSARRRRDPAVRHHLQSAVNPAIPDGLGWWRRGIASTGRRKERSGKRSPKVMFGSSCSLEILCGRHRWKAHDPVSNQIARPAAEIEGSMLPSLGKAYRIRRAAGLQSCPRFLKEEAVLGIAGNDVGHRRSAHRGVAVACGSPGCCPTRPLAFSDPAGGVGTPAMRGL